MESLEFKGEETSRNLATNGGKFAEALKKPYKSNDVAKEAGWKKLKGHREFKRRFLS